MLPTSEPARPLTDSTGYLSAGDDGGTQRKSYRWTVLSLSAALLYGFCAVSMNFVNKAALMAFPFTNTLLFIQMVAVLMLMFPLRSLGVITFPDLNARKARQLLPITLLYIGNVASALLGLKVLNIPMYSVLKRMTPMMVLVAKWRITKQAPPPAITASVAMVVMGCFIAGAGDLSFDLSGYLLALTSCLLQASYLLLVELSGTKQGTGTNELLVYNAALSLPFLAAVLLATGEGKAALSGGFSAASEMGGVHLVLLILVTSLAGVALNFSMFLCTNLNSALTTTIVGTLKGVAATFLGFFLLGGVEVHALNVAGIALNTLGGVAYSVVKYSSRK